MPRRNLAREILARPAMNGGWDKLARQQDEQCAQLVKADQRLAKVETWIGRWDTRQKWMLRLLGGVALSIVAKLIVEILPHFSIVVH